MNKMTKWAAALVLGVCGVGSAWAQQTIPGTSIIPAPIPVDISTMTEAEVSWALEDYLYETLLSNWGTSYTEADVVAIIENFIVSTSDVDFNLKCRKVILSIKCGF